MALLPKISDVTNFDTIKLNGGALHRIMTVSDPAGRFFVQCNKHPEYRNEITFSVLIYPGFIQRSAQQAINDCPRCVEERRDKVAYAASRFPEGSEL